MGIGLVTSPDFAIVWFVRCVHMTMLLAITRVGKSTVTPIKLALERLLTCKKEDQWFGYFKLYRETLLFFPGLLNGRSARKVSGPLLSPSFIEPFCSPPLCSDVLVAFSGLQRERDARAVSHPAAAIYNITRQENECEMANWRVFQKPSIRNRLPSTLKNVNMLRLGSRY